MKLEEVTKEQYQGYSCKQLYLLTVYKKICSIG